MARSQHQEIMHTLGKIEQHLAELNGRVTKNVNDIAKLRDDQTRDDMTMAKIAGGWKVLAVLGSLSIVVINLLLKYIQR
jgi:hypothetical protein